MAEDQIGCGLTSPQISTIPIGKRDIRPTCSQIPPSVRTLQVKMQRGKMPIAIRNKEFQAVISAQHQKVHMHNDAVKINYYVQR